ncbi:MAG: c-type cytochrome domain-containing protein, partial [Isosphaeraceae bacterium]
MSRIARFLGLLPLCGQMALAIPQAQGQGADQAVAAPSAAQVEFFEKSIRPLLADRCYKCHGAQAKPLKGGLRLDTREGLLRGGDGGPVVAPGDPDASPLIEAVRETDPLRRMPPDAPLSPREIDALVDWVRLGAVDPRVANDPVAAEGSAPKSRGWWSFQKPVPPRVPSVKNPAWPRGDVDRFLLAKLESQGLRPAP